MAEPETAGAITMTQTAQNGTGAITMTQADFNAAIASAIKAMGITPGALTRSAEDNAAEIGLETYKNGTVKQTINNMLIALRKMPETAQLRYNLMKNCPEMPDPQSITRRYNNADEAYIKNILELRYGLYHENRFKSALRILFKEREYNPLMDIIESTEWDGTERIEQFLTVWGKADDTPYVHEVSRLIFAGGINRLYNPGCKFDDVPVLVGKQGGGKSSLVRWLAINDMFFGEIKEINGQKAIEQLGGVWIGEVAELLALTKAKEQEDVKSYITTQIDRYRKPWDTQIEEYPRRCIFIGTTNQYQFLKDKTGNRRFYPVEVNCTGYDLYDHEQECRDYILQCWAEARVKYKNGQMPNYANRELWGEYQKAQENATEDDWRVGAIEKYLSSLDVGSFVCIRQLKREALVLGDDKPQDPTPKESQELLSIMGQMPGWEKAGRVRLADYGRQRAWQKVQQNASENGTLSHDELNIPVAVENSDDLPF